MTLQGRFTNEQKMHAAEREAKMRRRVYPRWVAEGRMTQAEADQQLAMMEEIAADYRWIAIDEDPQERLSL